MLEMDVSIPNLCSSLVSQALVPTGPYRTHLARELIKAVALEPFRKALPDAPEETVWIVGTHAEPLSMSRCFRSALDVSAQ